MGLNKFKVWIQASLIKGKGSKSPKSKRDSQTIDKEKVDIKGKSKVENVVISGRDDEANFEEDKASRPNSLESDKITDFYSHTQNTLACSQNEENDEEIIEDEDIDDIGDFEFEDGNEETNEFSCLTPEDLLNYQNKEIQIVADLLHVPLPSASVLLRHYKWKRERLLACYFENPKKVWSQVGGMGEDDGKGKGKLKDMEKVISKGTLDSWEIATNTSIISDEVSISSDCGSSNGISMKGSNSLARSPSTLRALEIDPSCSICGEENLNDSDSFALSCLHLFCLECWQTFLITKINEGKTDITCPGHNCPVHVEDSHVHKLVDDSYYSKYVSFVTRSFIQDNKEIVKWCPTPGCGNAVRMVSNNGNSSIVSCDCGYSFCFSCHREAHSPATCEQLKAWEEKSRDDSETGHWVTANTKGCIKCGVNVEKNGGCNHMTCPQCKTEYCWVCMKPWRGHSDFYSCNRYEKKLQKEKSRAESGKWSKAKRRREEEIAKQREALERYLHFSRRVAAHEQSKKMEAALKPQAKTKMQELLEEGVYTWAELLFISKALDQLIECRSVLKYTYVFAYYFLSPDNLKLPPSAKALFEMLQEDLEKTTEKLSEKIEKIIKGATYPIKHEHRLDIINCTSIEKTKMENILTAITNDPLFDTSLM
eukprot:TRINITY_DN5267_c0_g1_i1.p1 TRINITY_DN5267_c0_g1~~TRINITY_DN5267_c0_g1_i1.p1  ORF type:complete len:652 (+),score=121.35 TRINITY_DN5267_c0_g1_i1:1419-3374(+)